jgi:hypothetical protein
VAVLVPDVGEVVLLSDLLAGGSLENWTLKLFKNNVTPAEGDTAATYTVADFTGYANKTLTRTLSGSTWSTPSTSSGTTSSTYGAAAQSWSVGASGNTIYGAYVVGATSTTLIYSDLLATPRVLANGDTYQYTPKLQLD